MLLQSVWLECRHHHQWPVCQEPQYQHHQHLLWQVAHLPHLPLLWVVDLQLHHRLQWGAECHHRLLWEEGFHHLPLWEEGFHHLHLYPLLEGAECITTKCSKDWIIFIVFWLNLEDIIGTKTLHIHSHFFVTKSLLKFNGTPSFNSYIMFILMFLILYQITNSS